ncbi:MAG: hypothetical protein ACNI3H_11460 [Halarcobacter ebronensis]
MQFQKLASLFFVSTIFLSSSFAQEVDEKILSQDRLDIIDFSKNKMKKIAQS